MEEKGAITVLKGGNYKDNIDRSLMIMKCWGEMLGVKNKVRS